MEEPRQRPSRHVCLTVRGPIGISSDPELDILTALADPDVLAVVRGLTDSEIRSPFTGGAFGLDEPALNAAVRRMKSAGLISSRRDGPDHVYFLNRGRFRQLMTFLEPIVRA
ncbi:MAG: helix-turn-helix transcriptional regulator [Candidatus Methanomethylophilaceae archaeon]|nr:helix-turn-helix transcriptional regulator [Candidatus Methanomethylophilaceae archaeon]